MENKVIYDALMSIKGTKEVEVTYTREVKLRKKGNPFIDNVVTKTTTSTLVFTDQSYTKMNGLDETVKRELPYGSWGNGDENRLVIGKTGPQVRFYSEKGKISSCTYSIDGVSATDEETAKIKEFLPTHKVVEDTSGTPYDVRNITLSYIDKVVIDGKVFNRA